MPSPSPSPNPRWHLTLWLVTFAVVACSQPAPTPSVASCPQSARAEAASLRLLVSFHQPTPGDAPALLAKLQSQTGACVRYAATVSATLHAYAFDTSVDAQTLSARLLRWSAIKAVAPDALARRQ